MQLGQALADEIELLRKNWKIEFKVDPRGIGLRPRRRLPAPRDEGAAPHFAHRQAAAQELAVDAAGRGCSDAARVGERALRRQAVAGLQAPGGNIRGNGVGKLQIGRHECTESNVLIASVDLRQYAGSGKQNCTEEGVP